MPIEWSEDPAVPFFLLWRGVDHSEKTCPLEPPRWLGEDVACLEVHVQTAEGRRQTELAFDRPRGGKGKGPK